MYDSTQKYSITTALWIKIIGGYARIERTISVQSSNVAYSPLVPNVHHSKRKLSNPCRHKYLWPDNGPFLEKLLLSSGSTDQRLVVIRNTVSEISLCFIFVLLHSSNLPPHFTLSGMIPSFFLIGPFIRSAKASPNIGFTWRANSLSVHTRTKKQSLVNFCKTNLVWEVSATFSLPAKQTWSE